GRRQSGNGEANGRRETDAADGAGHGTSVTSGIVRWHLTSTVCGGLRAGPKPIDSALGGQFRGGRTEIHPGKGWGERSTLQRLSVVWPMNDNHEGPFPPEAGR